MQNDKIPPQVQPQHDWGDATVAGRREQMHKLADLALKLREQKMPGVQLWSELTRAAIDGYAGSRLTPEMRCDFVFQDLAVVILGPYAIKYLRWFDKITPDLVQDPMVNQFFSAFGRFALPEPEPVIDWRNAGYVSKLDDALDPGLDRRFGADFRKEINDLTDNQIFHTFFYQFMAYVTRAALTIRAASVYHEIADKGGSTEDHTAALIGIRVGSEMRRLRDSGQPELEQWPDMILAAYARQVETLSPLARTLRTEIDTLVAKPQGLDSAMRGIEYALIRLVKGE